MSPPRFQSRTPPSQEAAARALWRKYRDAAAELSPAPPIDLAAYAEGRLHGVERARAEAYLARHPAALADMIAARPRPPKRDYFVSVRAGARAGAGWGASLCGFVLALWLGFTTGQLLANAEEVLQNLNHTGEKSNVNL